MHAPEFVPPAPPDTPVDPGLLPQHDEHRGFLRGIKTPTPYGRLLAPGVTGTRAMWEATAIMAIALVLGYAFSPTDPLFLHLAFPYAWILPLILALRYGSLMGLFSAFVMLGGWFILYAGIGPLPEAGSAVFPRAFFLGGLLLIFIAGQFGDIWAGRLARANAVNGYLSDRLSALTKNHFLLLLSHEHLENDLLAKPTTLRDTLSQLRRVVLTESERARELPGATQLVELAAHACQLETAALYAVTNDRIANTPAAHVGLPFDLHPHDPLLSICMNRKTLVHLQSPELQDGKKTDYIACVPLLCDTDELIGILVVKHMPFLSLNHENLQFLLVLMGYYADGTRQAEATTKILRVIPDCPHEFALDYVRLTRLQRETGVESNIVALRFGKHDMQDVISTHVSRGIRALDVSWPVQTGDSVVLIILMPLSGNNAVAGYLLRVEESMRAHFGVDFGQANVAVQSTKVGVQNGDDALLRLLTRMHIHE